MRSKSILGYADYNTGIVKEKKKPAILFKDAVKYEWVKWLLMRTALN